MILDDIFLGKKELSPSEGERLSAEIKKMLRFFNVVSIVILNITVIWVGEFSIVFLLFSIVGFLPIILFIAIKLSDLMVYLLPENSSDKMRRFNYFKTSL